MNEGGSSASLAYPLMLEIDDLNVAFIGQAGDKEMEPK